jgi:pimeloyl-ACP methyl ester carboxylesterase
MPTRIQFIEDTQMASQFPEATIYQIGDINMEVFEQGEGYPVILAHGFPELAYSWRHQIPVLAKAGYRVIAPNQRGYGATDKPESVEAYDLQHLCGDMAGLMDTLGIDKAIFIGHDWGGPVVWNMPLRYPDRVAGVVSLSVPYSPRGDFDPVAALEMMFGPDQYIVHFNRQPGVADAALKADTKNSWVTFSGTANFRLRWRNLLTKNRVSMCPCWQHWKKLSRRDNHSCP